MLGNGEVQSVGAGASIIVCIIVCVNATLSIDDIVPCVLLTGILMEGVMRSVVNCQVEGVDVGAG